MIKLFQGAAAIRCVMVNPPVEAFGIDFRVETMIEMRLAKMCPILGAWCGANDILRENLRFFLYCDKSVFFCVPSYFLCFLGISWVL